MAGMRAPASAAVEAAQEAGDDDLLAEALTFSGIAAVFLGHTTEADGLLEQARAVSRSAGLPWTHAHAVIADGQRLIGIGDLTGAAARIDEGERLARALGNPFTLVTALNVRGSLTQLTGDDDAALAAYTEAVDISARLEARWTMTYTLAGLAAIAALRGHPELAAELFAVGSATAEAGSVAVAYPPDLEVVRRWLPVVRGQLGEDAFRRAWERGRGLRLTDIPSLAARINGRSAPA
jgi:tetratricopeptide (TPR) repeat protein